jgi:chromosomal replication initiation ATPase DnaA
VHLTSSALSRQQSDPAAANSTPPAGFHATSKRRDEVAQEMCECLIDIAAALFSVSSKELRRPGRTSDAASRVRQIAMYVAHVVLRLTQAEVGRGFGRERTTVLHACHIVEDLRDDAEFDHVVSMVERIAQAAFRARLDI